MQIDVNKLNLKRTNELTYIGAGLSVRDEKAQLMLTCSNNSDGFIFMYFDIEEAKAIIENWETRITALENP